MRKGIIDLVHEQYETLRKTHRNAMPIVKLIEPTIYKRQMYVALERMLKFDLVEFFDFDNRDYLTLICEDGGYETYRLSFAERLVMVQNNLLKNELSYMCRYETDNGNVQYNLSTDKRNKMNDDRADTCAMAGLWLSEARRGRLAKPAQSNTKSFGGILNLVRAPNVYAK